MDNLNVNDIVNLNIDNELYKGVIKSINKNKTINVLTDIGLIKNIPIKLIINDQDNKDLNKTPINFNIDDMKKAFNAGARNGSNAGMRVARGGELNMKHFDEWFSEKYDRKCFFI